MNPQRLTNSAGKLPRYKTVDLLRGVACLIVIAVHANQQNDGVADPHGVYEHLGNTVTALLKRGWIAAPMFFVISGFGISQAVDGMRRKPAPAKNFLWRRFLRLYPPYLLSLALISLFVLAFDSLAPFSFSDQTIRHPYSLSMDQWIGNYTLTEYARPHVFGDRPKALAGHFWTLYYEQQFYLIVGIVLFFARAKYFAVCAILTVAVVALQFLPGWMTANYDGFLLNGLWLIFACGILVYWQVTYASRKQTVLCNLTYLLVMIFAARDPSKLMSPTWTREAGLFFTAGFSLVLANSLVWDHRIGRIFWLKPLAACAIISYSIYLTHPLVVRAVGLTSDAWLPTEPSFRAVVLVPLTIVLSLPLGWAFYYVVERRFCASSAPTRATREPAHGATAEAPAASSEPFPTKRANSLASHHMEERDMRTSERGS